MLLRVMVLWTALPLVYQGERRTLDYNYGWGVDHISWDSPTISKGELVRWMQLSPVLSSDNGFLVPEDISQCVAEDQRYHHCPHEDFENQPIDMGNARVTLDIIAARLSHLTRDDYPQDLSPVVHYFETVQTLAWQRGAHELAFFKTGDIAALEERLDTVDPSIACKAQIDQIRSAHDKQMRSKLVRFDWENCLWFAAQKQIGPYPEEAWKNFLAAQGITEVNEEESPD